MKGRPGWSGEFRIGWRPLHPVRVATAKSVFGCFVEILHACSKGSFNLWYWEVWKLIYFIKFWTNILQIQNSELNCYGWRNGLVWEKQIVFQIACALSVWLVFWIHKIKNGKFKTSKSENENGRRKDALSNKYINPPFPTFCNHHNLKHPTKFKKGMMTCK